MRSVWRFTSFVVAPILTLALAIGCSSSSSSSGSTVNVANPERATWLFGSGTQTPQGGAATVLTVRDILGLSLADVGTACEAATSATEARLIIGDNNRFSLRGVINGQAVEVARGTYTLVGSALTLSTTHEADVNTATCAIVVQANSDPAITQMTLQISNNNNTLTLTQVDNSGETPSTIVTVWSRAN